VTCSVGSSHFKSCQFRGSYNYVVKLCSYVYRPFHSLSKLLTTEFPEPGVLRLAMGCTSGLLIFCKKVCVCACVHACMHVRVQNFKW